VSEIYIKKSVGGNIFFEITLEKGVTPQELSGKYSSIRKAQEALELHLRNKKITRATRTEYFNKQREERKKVTDGSKSKSKDN
jgi:hypothetical protein|tara:strand:+ start:177 stop:425 length:249 start_codon:yes stop_codon:yes gene_type:complete